MEKGRQLVDSNFALTEGPFLASSYPLVHRNSEAKLFHCALHRPSHADSAYWASRKSLTRLLLMECTRSW